MSHRDFDTSVVIKLGGSLLDLPDLASRLTNFLSDLSRPRPVVLCGGGPTVDLVRAWDRQFNLGEEASHWIALQALTVNSRVVANVVERVEYTASIDDLPAIWSRGGVPAYDALAFIRDIDEHSSSPLPRRWRVTSDSIAARLASYLAAPELVLLKSAPLPEAVAFEDAAEEGIVDPYFPVVAPEVERVVCVNLRAEEPTETTLHPRPSA